MLTKELIAKIRRIEIRTNRRVADLFAGQYHSVFKGQGIAFQEVREYLPGSDDVGRIDWNVTARTGCPHVKILAEERQLTVMLVVDISASQQFGSTAQCKRDLLAEISAVLAFSAVRNNDRVGLILFAQDLERYVAPSKGATHVLRVIREVLHFQPRSHGTRLTAALEFLNHVAPRRTVAFLMSDFLDSGFERALAVTAKRHDLIGVAVADPREQDWPRVGLVAWRDAESGRRYLVDTSDARAQRAMRAACAARRTQLRRVLKARNVDMIEVTAGAPYERELVDFFRMRERRLRT